MHYAATCSSSTRRLPRPQRLVNALTALALCSAAPACLAFGDVGALPSCATFTTCSAAVGSSGSRVVSQQLTNISTGFAVPPDLAPGVTNYADTDSNASSVVLTVGAGVVPGGTSEFGRSAVAKAQSDFAVNRVETIMSRGVAGQLTRGTGTASLRLSTFAQASSAWRDVWAFSGSGQFSAVVVLDGSSALGAVGPFDASFDFSPLSTSADWFYDLRVWDVTHLSVSNDFELGGPTAVGRARLTGNNETRPSLDSSVALNFAFASGVSYVVTAELRATSYDGREIDLFHTVRLQGVALTGGAQMATLSGHDYLAPVPEPAPALLWLAGISGLAAWARRRVAVRTARAAVVAGLLAAGSAQAGLLGDTVGAKLQDIAGGVVAPQFSPTAVVGAGVEFTGTWTYAPLNQVWNVALDIGASSFTITFTDVGINASHDISGFTFMGLVLSDLDPGGIITGVSLLSGQAGVQSVGFSDHGITVQWNIFQFRNADGNPINSGSSTFGFQTAPVPEPAPAGLLALGLLTLAVVRKRQGSARRR